MRVFLAIPVSDEIKERVGEIQKELAEIDGKLNLVRPEILHLTLKFFGEVDKQQLEKIKEKLSRLDLRERFSLKAKGVGVFPNKDHIKVIWFGLEDHQKLKQLYHQVNSAFDKDFPEKREFSAHITLARVKFVKNKYKLIKFLDKYRNIDLGEMTVDQMILYESKLNQQGPEYAEIKEYKFIS